MAKYGAGDARWIVEERKDGTNVNQWHWTEKDCLPWAKARLGELFENLKVLDGQGSCHIRISSLESVQGEAYVNVRKGKIIPGYELSVKLKWEGQVKDLAGAVVAATTGSIEMPYVSEENHDEDPEIRVGVSEDSPPAQRLRQAMVQEGRPLIRKRMATFVEELRAGGPVREELKRGPPKGQQAQPDEAAKRHSTGAQADGASAAENATRAEQRGDTKAQKPKEKAEEKGKKTISMTQHFRCRKGDLYDTLMDEKRWMGFTHAKAEISREIGGSFSLFNGSVSGTNEKLVQDSLIVQRWRFNVWPDGVHSMVCMSIEEPEPGDTILRLTQTGVPEEDKFGNATVFETTERGWRELIFGCIRAVFGYGV